MTDLDQVFFRKEYLLNSLRSLGKTPEEVAQTFIDLGIKGVRTDPHSCPVTNFVVALPEPWLRRKYVMTTVSSGVTVYPYEDYLETRIRVHLPPPVRDFVDFFDIGGFPGLEEHQDA